MTTFTYKIKYLIASDQNPLTLKSTFRKLLFLPIFSFPHRTNLLRNIRQSKSNKSRITVWVMHHESFGLESYKLNKIKVSILPCVGARCVLTSNETNATNVAFNLFYIKVSRDLVRHTTWSKSELSIDYLVLHNTYFVVQVHCWIGLSKVTTSSSVSRSPKRIFAKW